MKLFTIRNPIGSEIILKNQKITIFFNHNEKEKYENKIMIVILSRASDVY